MNDETELDQTVAASEQPVVESQDTPQEEQRMVPLAALEAERKKRQDAEAKSQLFQDYMMRSKEEEKAAKHEEEDPNALVEKKDLLATTAITKREILEDLYQEMNPEAVQKINKYLNQILEKKPWLADSVHSAKNRYARAYEIVEDYVHLIEGKPSQKSVPSNNEGKKIVENSQKPRSPVEIGKSQQPGSTAYLKSIQGKKEFREYRTRLMRGDV